MEKSWIKQQAECNPRSTFLALVALLGEDVQEYNDLPTEHRLNGNRFRLSDLDKDQTALTIYLLGPSAQSDIPIGPSDPPVVTLQRTSEGIIDVKYRRDGAGDGNVIPPLDLTIETIWDRVKQECVYRLEEKGVSRPWEASLQEASQKILQPLFFVP